MIIVAGDNLFSEPLTNFVAQAKGSKATLATYDVGDFEAIKKYANITIDADGVITQFEEKPAKPHRYFGGDRSLLFFKTRSSLSSPHISLQGIIPINRDGSSNGFTPARR